MTDLDNWKQELSDILGSYFGDQSVEEGVFELIFFLGENHDFHETVKSVFSNGLKSVREGDKEVLNDIAKQIFITDRQDAENFLKELGKEYDRQYKLTLRKIQQLRESL
jgi:hypothetical protein